MRIAFVSEVFLPAVDGVVTRLRRTLEELHRSGDEVMVIAPAGGPPSYAQATVVGMRPLRMPLYPDGDGYPEKRFSLPGPALGRSLAAFAPDVVHAINPMLLGAGATFHARRLGIPLVASYHANVPGYARYYGLGPAERLGWRYVRALHNRADVNLCTSNATLRMLRGRGIERLSLWPYGVEHARFGPRHGDPAWRTRLGGGDPDRMILLYVGRLAKEKSVGDLLPAVATLPGVALAIVGDGPLRGELEAAFAGTPTTFTGLLTGDDLARAYASADAFVFPSRSETLGMVMLEAHATALPVVAANSPAARELVRDGTDGMLYDGDDPGSLAAAVRFLRDNRPRRIAMGEAGCQAVAGASWASATAMASLLVTAALLTLALTKIDLAAVGTTLSSVSAGWVAVALALMGGSFFARGESWFIALRAAVPAAPLTRALVIRGLLIGAATSEVTPGRLGEAARSLIVARRLGETRRTLAVVGGTVLFQLLLNVLALGAIATTGANLSAGVSGALAGVLVLPLVVVGLLIAAPRWLTPAARTDPRGQQAAGGADERPGVGPGVRRGVRPGVGPGVGPGRRSRAAAWLSLQLTLGRRGLAALRAPRTAARASAAQLGAWAMQLATCAAVLRAAHLHPATPIAAACGVLFAVNVTAAFPATPANVGVFQAACIGVLDAFGVGADRALAYGLILQAIEIASALALGIPALLAEGLSFRALRDERL
jgi:glycosyltransferase involved in cell wall biosynthesis